MNRRKTGEARELDRQRSAYLIAKMLPLVHAAAEIAETSEDVTGERMPAGRRIWSHRRDAMENLLRQVRLLEPILRTDGVTIGGGR